MLTQRCRRWSTNGGPPLHQRWANVSCYLVFLAPGWKAAPAYQCSSQETRYNHPMLFQCWANVGTLKQHWVNATCLPKVYSRPSDGLVLGQRRRRLTGIEPANGCDAGLTLKQNLVGRPTSSVQKYISGKRMNVGQHQRWWWKEYTLNVYFNLSLWFFSE